MNGCPFRRLGSPIRGESSQFLRDDLPDVHQNIVMDINRFTEKLQEAIRAAQSKATRYGHQQLDVEHLLASLLEQEGGLAGSILSRAGVNTDTLNARVEQELERLPKVSGQTGARDQIY